MKYTGATNDVVVSKLTITGQGSGTKTLTSSNVEITSGTSFSVTRNAADKTAVDLLLNKAGTTSIGGTTYNIAAAEDWMAGTNTATVIADLTSNPLTVSNPKSVFDTTGSPLSFNTSSLISGNGTAVNSAYLYANVITIGGQQIDAIVTLSALSNATLTSFDSTANPYSNTAYFQPNITINSAGGYGTFTVKFILGGAGITAANYATNPGTLVTLRDVVLNTYDLDGAGGNAAGRQFTDLTNIGGYTLSTSTQLTASDLGGGVTRFLTTVGGNITAAPGTAAGDNIRAQATFSELSQTTIKLGDTSSTGISYYGIDFSAQTTFTNPKVYGITITGGPVTTQESGTSGTFSVVLTSAPTQNVTVNLSGLDATEGSLSTNSLTVTSANWSTPQTVTVTGVDDQIIDGNIRYTITATGSSTDTGFNGRTAVVDVINTDNDVANSVAPVAVADTRTLNEGATDSFNILANDTDADSGTILSVAQINGTVFGSLTASADATYTTALGYKQVTLSHGTLFVKSDGTPFTGTTGRRTSPTASPTKLQTARLLRRPPRRSAIPLRRSTMRRR